jgi:hypothetical protein
MCARNSKNKRLFYEHVDTLKNLLFESSAPSAFAQLNVGQTRLLSHLLSAREQSATGDNTSLIDKLCRKIRAGDTDHYNVQILINLVA